jgi:DUF4097 and DUF4098 domain-containing protein YvlB
MREKLLLPVLAAGLLSLSACDWEDLGGSERFHHDFHYSYPLKSGGALSVETFNGSIEISGWDQETVDISGTTTGPTQEEADNLKVGIDHSADAVSVRVQKPSYRRNNLGARFVIKAPRGVRLDRIVTSNGPIRTMDVAGSARLHTSNGGVRVERLQGDVDVETSNGGIDLRDVDGQITAHTSNGHIHAEGNRADAPVRVESSNGPVELAFPSGFHAAVRARTSNGGITLHLPPDLNAQVSAHTSNSSITTDYEVHMQGSVNKHQLEAMIGTGGPLIDLSTSNGPIRLLRR